MLEIKRRGSTRSDGERSICIDDAAVSVNGGQVIIKASNIADFNERSRHDYQISVSEEAVCEIIKAFGDGLADNPISVAGRRLESLAPDLLRILRAIV